MTRRPSPALTPGPATTARPAAALTRTLLALLAALACAVGAVLPAAAHDALTGSTPADGATVEAPPASVDLTFTEPPLALGTEVQVTGPDGASVADGPVTLSGTTVSQPLVADLPAGVYAVVWRVTSADGHPISGELSFTATAGTGAPAGATDDPGAEPTSDPAVEEPTEPATAPTAPAAEPSTGETLAPAPGPADGAATARDGGGALPWLLGGLVVAAVVAAAWVARRRRSGASGGV